MQERVANHLMASLFEGELTTREEAPRRLEVRIARLFQRLARLGNCLVERGDELLARVQGRRLVVGSVLGRDIQFVHRDRHADP